MSNTASGAGGGIDNYLATLQVLNSTLSGNTAATGGGVYFLAEPKAFSDILTDVTISNNRATSGTTAGGGAFVQAGNALIPTVTPTVTLQNTIVGGNFGGASGAAAADVAGSLVAASASNLIGDGANMTGISNGTNGNQVGSSGSPIDPKLDVLADDTGPAKTMALLPGSPAFGAGAIFNDSASVPIAVDERGITRPAGSVDIGTFETDRNPPASFAFAGEYSVATVGSGTPTLASIAQSGTSLTLNGSSSQSATVLSTTQIQVGATTATCRDSQISFGSTGPFANQTWTKIDLPPDFTNLQGNATHVIQNGSAITFVDKYARISVGSWISPTELSAFGDTLTITHGKLAWSDGSFWFENLALTGSSNGNPTAGITSVPSEFTVFDYDNGHGGKVHVIETGSNNVVFVDGLGNFSLGSFINMTQATTPAFANDRATFSDTGTSVTWQDGYVWTQIAPTGQITVTDYTKVNGVTAHVIQNGTLSVVISDSMGDLSIGTFTDSTHVTDPRYAGDAATFGVGTVTWQDGMVWTQVTPPPPPLLISATNPAGGVSRLELLSRVKLVGLDGPLKVVFGLRLDGKIFWSNGDDWNGFDFNNFNALFVIGTA